MISTFFTLGAPHVTRETRHGTEEEEVSGDRLKGLQFGCCSFALSRWSPWRRKKKICGAWLDFLEQRKGESCVFLNNFGGVITPILSDAHICHHIPFFKVLIRCLQHLSFAEHVISQKCFQPSNWLNFDAPLIFAASLWRGRWGALPAHVYLLPWKCQQKQLQNRQNWMP